MIQQKADSESEKNKIMGRVSDAKKRLMDAVAELIWTGSYGSTTIDQICDKAGVKKGSFYYFFESKADVAVAALDAEFVKKRVEMDSVFSPTIPPLERIRNYCESSAPRSALESRSYGQRSRKSSNTTASISSRPSAMPIPPV